MTYNYKLENFLSYPVNGDNRLFINDKNGNFVDSITTDISHAFVKNNCLIIKITNKNDLILSFESRTVAQQALSKLESYRKSLMISTGEITIMAGDRPTFNTLNHYMMANYVTGNTLPALQNGQFVAQKPKSSIKIIVNQGSFVYCGKPDFILSGSTYVFYSPVGCYFTDPQYNGDPSKARTNDGDVQYGDVLYWIVHWANEDKDNPLGGRDNYPLDLTDTIDFEYLI